MPIFQGVWAYNRQVNKKIFKLHQLSNSDMIHRESRLDSFFYDHKSYKPFMQSGQTLEFECQECKHPIRFSIFEIEIAPEITCAHCSKNYSFDDLSLKRQLRKFEALCRQIRESEEILGQTAVGVDVGGKQVKIPFKLLLTRLSSCLDLSVGGKPLTIAFRFEPLKDTPEK